MPKNILTNQVSFELIIKFPFPFFLFYRVLCYVALDFADEDWFKTTTYDKGFHEFLSRKDISPHLQNDILYLKARIVAMSTVEEF